MNFVVLVFLAFSFSAPVYKLSVSDSQYGKTGAYRLESGSGPYPPDPRDLKLDVYYQTSQRVHFKIMKPDTKYFEIPEVLQCAEVTQKASNLNYDVTFGSDGGIIITRKSPKAVIFDSSNSPKPMILEEEFIQLSTSLRNNPVIYGLGQRRSRLALPFPFNYSLVNQDRQCPADGKHLYSSHPFYIELLPDGTCYGVLFFNSAPAQAELLSNRLTFQSMNGYLDFYVFMGPTQKDVMDQYTELVGRPCIVPQWVLGYHNCHWGYPSIKHIMNLVKEHEQKNIPLDVQWVDIDYMDEKALFTTDPVNYPVKDIQAYLDWMHKNDQRSIVIVDPGIKVQAEGYLPYREFLESGYFLKTPEGRPYVGRVWPGDTIFPDFTAKGGRDLWAKWVKWWLDETPYDGIWTDMNEIANFCSGYCDDRKPRDYPWIPQDVDLLMNSVPRELQTSMGTYLQTGHLYAHLENIACAAGLRLKYPGVRPFILSRSSFVGSGRTNTIWLGDNRATWSDLEDSISGVITAGLYGIPVSGHDVSGHAFDTNAQLMTRWVQMSAFLYPFMRTHSTIATSQRDVFYYGEPTTSYNRDALFARHRIQSYLYTLLHEAHRTGTPITRALSMEFPTDLKTLRIDGQAMVGSALLVTPVFKPDVSSVGAYFPKARWYNFWTWEEDAVVTGGDRSVVLPVGPEKVPVHIRGGSIHTQQEDAGKALQVAKIWDKPLTVVVALDESGKAEGEVVVDDHQSDNDKRVRVNFKAHASTITNTLLENSFDSSVLIRAYKVLGLKCNGVSSATVKVNGEAKNNVKINYDAAKKILDIRIEGAEGWPLKANAEVSWVEK